MIVCTQCSHRNEDGDDFCGSCGAFLEFAGQREEQPVVVAVEAAAPVESERPSVVARVKQAVGLTEGPPAEVDSVTDDTTVELGGEAEEAARLAEQARIAAEREERAARERAAAEQAERLAEESATRAAAEAERERVAAAEASQRAAEQRRLEQAQREAGQEKRRLAEIDRARREADEQARRVAAEQAAADERAAEQADAERKAQLAAEERARLEAEAASAAEADERARREALAQAAREQEERAAAEAAQATAEAADRARLDDERRRAEEAAREQERLAREAEEEAQRGVEERARLEAEEQARLEQAAAEAAAEAAAADSARLEAERQARAKAAREAAARAEHEAKAALAKGEAADRARRRAAALIAPPRVVPPVAVQVAAPATQPGTAASSTAASGSTTETAEVMARQPTAERGHRPAPQAGAKAPEPINPGDLVCGNCGVGNTPERKFCRRCGTSLVAAAVAPRPPWYRRLVTRRRKVVAAGERRGRAKEVALDTSGRKKRHAGPMVKKVVTLSLAGAALVVLAVPSLRTQAKDDVASGARAVKRVVSPSYARVTPTGARATSSLAGHPASLLVDGINQTWWGGSVQRSGVDQRVTVIFKDAVDIDRIGFKVGASSKKTDFTTQPRPRKVHLTFDDGTTKDLELKDTGDLQTYGVKARGVKDMTLDIRSVVAGQKGSAPAIAELEFFVKQ